eukprot:SAG11_NODE_1139_length_5714_cov_20.900267_5_plen_40_part_00
MCVRGGLRVVTDCIQIRILTAVSVTRTTVLFYVRGYGVY